MMHWREYQKRQRIVELGYQFLSYYEDGQGEPVVMIHGIPSWGYPFIDLVEALKGQSRVLVPDLLGFGYSDKGDTFDRSISKQAEALVAWMDLLSIERAALVAHDIGGGIALRLATLYPERVSQLCLMNSVCYDSWPIESMLQLGHPSIRTLAAASTTLSVIRMALRTGFTSTPSDELLEGMVAPYLTEVGKTSLIRNAGAMNTNQTTEITHLLPSIIAPTLIVWGEDDPFLPIAYGERLASDIPNSELIRVEDANHYVMHDQPELVARTISEFLSSERKKSK